VIALRACLLHDASWNLAMHDMKRSAETIVRLARSLQRIGPPRSEG
jgi:hypothetical protein